MVWKEWDESRRRRRRGKGEDLRFSGTGRDGIGDEMARRRRELPSGLASLIGRQVSSPQEREEAESRE